MENPLQNTENSNRQDIPTCSIMGWKVRRSWHRVDQITIDFTLENPGVYALVTVAAEWWL
jgi:hypothetical protein